MNGAVFGTSFSVAVIMIGVVLGVFFSDAAIIDGVTDAVAADAVILNVAGVTDSSFVDAVVINGDMDAVVMDALLTDAVMTDSADFSPVSISVSIGEFNGNDAERERTADLVAWF